MRWPWLAVGIALAVVGAILLYVPVLPQGSETATYSTSNGNPQYSYFRSNLTGFSLSGTIVVDVSWTSNTSTPVQVIAAACTAACDGDFQHLSDVTNETGTRGSFVLDQPNGGSIVMGVFSTASGKDASVTFRITSSLATAASALVVAGSAVAIAAVLAKRRPRSPAPAPASGLPSGRVDPDQ